MNYKLNKHIPAAIFRAYDIRGTIEDELKPDNVYSIGLAIGTAVRVKGQHTVIIARDGRLSSPILSLALAQGLIKSGCHVIDIGMVPTPVLYFATHRLATNSGVMLTGSHNPAHYNGLKIVLNGESLAEEKIADLYRRIVENDLLQGIGTLTQADVLDDYINTIIAKITLQRPLKIVIDCGSGVAGVVAPRLFKLLGCDVTELYCEVDGRFPYHHPDPSKAENVADLIKKVQAINADVGLAFDGDGDRLGVISDAGEMIYPDRQLMLFAIDTLSRNPGATVIYDIKSSRHLGSIIEQHGGTPLLWKTGHSLIKSKMLETKALLAGEMSGHLFFKENWFGFDDGIYAGVRLAEIMARKNKALSSLFDSIPHDTSTPEINIAMSDATKFAFVKRLIGQARFANGKKITVDGLRVEFGYGWGLIRCSNTTPNLVLRFEADDTLRLEQIKILFKAEIRKLDPNLKLDF